MPIDKGSDVPDYVFEASWEVCNKVGGIFTVLSSRAKTMQTLLGDEHVIFVGPDLGQTAEDGLFQEDTTLLPAWRKSSAERGQGVRIGRWLIPGSPVAALVDFKPLFQQRIEIYRRAWEDWQVDSLHGYGDYDEASMFSEAAGRFAEHVVSGILCHGEKVVYQAHEWMAGLGMLHLKKHCPTVATIFTTHATSIGRSIAGNNKQLYAYFDGYQGDQMARELSMEAKHSIEKQSAQRADCFTTVSTFTARECKQLLEREPDVVLPNGFEQDFVPRGAALTAKRTKARRRILQVVESLTWQPISKEVLIVSTSGRNDFRCKGFDVYLEALARLNAGLKGTQDKEDCTIETVTKVVALIEVPCWLLGRRTDLSDRLASGELAQKPLSVPMITHDLHNLNEDRILCMIKQLGLWNSPEDPVKVVLVPCYLEGNDGIFDLPYYDLLTANDLAVYPSYYEPWGYTPLEACAFSCPCVTTDLSGFGQWVQSDGSPSSLLQTGVSVLHRDDSNYDECAGLVADSIQQMLYATPAQRKHARQSAKQLADKAQWKHFIKHYLQAYQVAISQRDSNPQRFIGLR